MYVCMHNFDNLHVHVCSIHKTAANKTNSQETGVCSSILSFGVILIGRRRG